MTYLPFVTNIFQFYKAFCYLIFLSDNLRLLASYTTLTPPQFQWFWTRAKSNTEDLLVFMWAIGELTLSLGNMQIMVGSPSFFMNRFCACVRLKCFVALYLFLMLQKTTYSQNGHSWIVTMKNFQNMTKMCPNYDERYEHKSYPYNVCMRVPIT